MTEEQLYAEQYWQVLERLVMIRMGKAQGDFAALLQESKDLEAKTTDGVIIDMMPPEFGTWDEV